jgi:protein-tyrosine-phosphatase
MVFLPNPLVECAVDSEADKSLCLPCEMTARLNLHFVFNRGYLTANRPLHPFTGARWSMKGRVKSAPSKYPLIMNVNNQIFNILFVCVGNICRSPFAQGLFTKMVRQEGHENFRARSAGLLALPGNSVTFLAQKVASAHGVDLTGYEAKRLSQELVDWSQLILVMEKSHKDELLTNFTGAADKSYLLRRFARFGSRNRGIADPYGLEYDAYRFCYLDIEDAVLGLVEYLTDQA